MFNPLSFLRRLVSPLPRPYGNLVRYHGVFANRSKFRVLLPKPTPRVPINASIPDESGAPDASQETGGGEATPIAKPMPVPPSRRHRSPWAQLLRWVLDVDALPCPRCRIPMRIIAPVYRTCRWDVLSCSLAQARRARSRGPHHRPERRPEDPGPPPPSPGSAPTGSPPVSRPLPSRPAGRDPSRPAPRYRPTRTPP